MAISLSPLLLLLLLLLLPSITASPPVPPPVPPPEVSPPVPPPEASPPLPPLEASPPLPPLEASPPLPPPEASPPLPPPEASPPLTPPEASPPLTPPEASPPLTPPEASPPLPPPEVSPPMPSPPPREQQQQLNNIIDALIGTGDFGGWADLLSSVDPSTLPMTATLFIPSDEATTAAAAATSPLNPMIFPYHIVPQRLAFSNLQRFTTGSRLPTLLPTMSILITNNSLSNFTVDGSSITHPDLYLASGVSVHGVASVLDYSLYGSEASPPPPEEVTVQPTLPPPPPPSVGGETWGHRKSDAVCLAPSFLSLFRLFVP